MPEPVYQSATSLSVKIADCAEDIAAVQRLRWRVFHEEMGALSLESNAFNLDSDVFDSLCDHLLVIAIDANGAKEVVGTYRLLRESVARQSFGFYTASEFDITRLVSNPRRSRGDLLELGRSCVLAPYRTSATIQLLWRGIAEYISRYRIGMMFGCASFPGIDPDAHGAALSWLYHHHLAPGHERPRVHAARGAQMERLPRGTYDERRALHQLPPLIKGYLRAGAKFGDGVFIDREFNTVDVCVVMPVEALAERYAARFSLAA